MLTFKDCQAGSNRLSHKTPLNVRTDSDAYIKRKEILEPHMLQAQLPQKSPLTMNDYRRETGRWEVFLSGFYRSTCQMMCHLRLSIHCRI